MAILALSFANYSSRCDSFLLSIHIFSHCGKFNFADYLVGCDSSLLSTHIFTYCANSRYIDYLTRCDNSLLSTHVLPIIWLIVRIWCSFPINWLDMIALASRATIFQFLDQLDTLIRLWNDPRIMISKLKYREGKKILKMWYFENA